MVPTGDVESEELGWGGKEEWNGKERFVLLWEGELKGKESYPPGQNKRLAATA